MNRRLVDAALGNEPADLLVTNVRLLNVLSGEIHDACFSVADGFVAGFEEVDAREVLDGQGRFCCPGLIDGHIHIESTMLTPPGFARIAAAHGTAAVVCDPHEIANVLGLSGVEYMVAASRDLPVTFHFMAPSCVPATHLETAEAELSAEAVAELFRLHPDRFPGLAEMMNYPGLLFGDEAVWAKLEAAQGKVLDGHAPMLHGKDLSAYIAAGPDSDHETVALDEAREKLRKGMFLMIREGSQEHNLADLLEAVSDFNSANCCLVSDDRQAGDLVEHGHLDSILRKAMSQGLHPIRAVQMTSINTARRFGLVKRGAVAPGYRADFFLLDDLDEFRPRLCHSAGRPVEQWSAPAAVQPPARGMCATGLQEGVFRIPAQGDSLRVIGVVPGQIVTEHRLLAPTVVDGLAVADTSRDLIKLAVIERHHATGNVGLGFVQGLQTPRGALASTVAHDSHNLIVAGMNDDDMLAAARAVVDMGGGLAVVDSGEVRARLPLPVAGLMTDAPAEEAATAVTALGDSLRALGCSHADAFSALAFLALPVIPSLKLTDKGLVDVERFDFVSLFAD